MRLQHLTFRVSTGSQRTSIDGTFRGVRKRLRDASKNAQVKKAPTANTEDATRGPTMSGAVSCPSFENAEASPKPEPRRLGGKRKGVTTYIKLHSPPKKSANPP